MACGDFAAFGVDPGAALVRRLRRPPRAALPRDARRGRCAALKVRGALGRGCLRREYFGQEERPWWSILHLVDRTSAEPGWSSAYSRGPLFTSGSSCGRIRALSDRGRPYFSSRRGRCSTCKPGFQANWTCLCGRRSSDCETDTCAGGFCYIGSLPSGFRRVRSLPLEVQPTRWQAVWVQELLFS